MQLNYCHQYELIWMSKSGVKYMEKIKKIKFIVRLIILFISIALWSSREINGISFLIIFILLMLEIDVSSGSVD